jgi:hypothetical protein
MPLGDFFESVHRYLKTQDLARLLIASPKLHPVVTQYMTRMFRPLEQDWRTTITLPTLNQTLYKHFGPLAPNFLPRQTKDQWKACFAQCRGQEECNSKQCRRFRQQLITQNNTTAFHSLYFLAPEWNRHYIQSSRLGIPKHKLHLPDLSHTKCRQLDILARLGSFDVNLLPTNLVKLSLCIFRRLKTSIRLPDTLQECCFKFGNSSVECYRHPEDSHKEFRQEMPNSKIVIGATSHLRTLQLVNLGAFDDCMVDLAFEGAVECLTELTLKSVYTNLPELFASAATCMPCLNFLEFIPSAHDEYLETLTLPQTLTKLTIYHGRALQSIVYPPTLTSLHLRVQFGDQLDQKVPQSCPNLKRLFISDFMYDYSHTQCWKWITYTQEQLARIVLPSLEDFGLGGSHCSSFLLTNKKIEPSSEPLIARPNLKILRLWMADEFVLLTSAFSFSANTLKWVIFHDMTCGYHIDGKPMERALVARAQHELDKTKFVYTIADNSQLNRYHTVTIVK